MHPPPCTMNTSDSASNDSMHGLSTLSEEEVTFDTENREKSYSRKKDMKNSDGDDEQLKRVADSRKIRRSIVLSRSLEDLAHLADEDDDMTMAMHRDTYEMGLMSLRTPVE